MSATAETRPTTGPKAAPCDDCQAFLSQGRPCDACKDAMTTTPVPAPATHITTIPSHWSERSHDRRLPLTAALAFAKNLANGSKARDLNLDQFQVAFYDGKLYIESRNTELGHRFRYRLNHWSFAQLCSLVGAPAPYIRRKNGQLATENLNDDLRRRCKDVSVYRTHRDVEDLKQDTVRGFTSTTRYSRYWDYQLLEWVQLTGVPTTEALISDRSVEISLLGQHIPAPDYGTVRLTLMVGNSEVCFSSINGRAALVRDNWRIPLTVGAFRVRHVGDVEKKAKEKLETALETFQNANSQDLQQRLKDAAEEQEKTRGEWYAWLKGKGVGKALATKILPEGEGTLRTSRYRLAVRIAIRAADIPYFNDRLEAELVATKVLGL